MSEEKPFSFEGRLSRSKGRAGRDRVVSSRATADEHQELESAAKAEGKARSPRLNALFTEVVATRMLLNLLLKPIACGKQITEQEFSGVLTNVRTGKRQAASDLLQQYTAPEQKE